MYESAALKLHNSICVPEIVCVAGEIVKAARAKFWQRICEAVRRMSRRRFEFSRPLRRLLFAEKSREWQHSNTRKNNSAG